MLSSKVYLSYILKYSKECKQFHYNLNDNARPFIASIYKYYLLIVCFEATLVMRKMESFANAGRTDPYWKHFYLTRSFALLLQGDSVGCFVPRSTFT